MRFGSNVREQCPAAMSGSNVREQPIAPGKSVHDDQLPLHEGHRRPDQERACAGGQHLKPISGPTGTRRLG
jgi:hypothetical protein